MKIEELKEARGVLTRVLGCHNKWKGCKISPMIALILDYMVWFLRFLIVICLLRLSFYLCFFAGNKIWELIYRKDNHGESGEEGSTED